MNPPRIAPLSPHLQVYRLPPTALLSISHRLSGIFLSLGVCLWLVLLILLAWNPAVHDRLQSLLLTLPGRLFTGGFVFALCLHLVHGIRHLLWDRGLGLEPQSLNRLALAELAATVGLFLVCMASTLLP